MTSGIPMSLIRRVLIHLDKVFEGDTTLLHLLEVYKIRRTNEKKRRR